MEEVFQMSKKEIDRIKVLDQVRNKQITQQIAAVKLGVSERQIRNLLQRTASGGDEAIISRKRGKAGNHAKPAAFKSEVLSLINECYNDFGPKLAGKLHEKIS